MAQYESCREILAEEFGIEPMAQTTDLFEDIRTGRIGVEQSLTAVASMPLHNLPRSLTPFFGREKELVLLAEKLKDPDYPLITLVGEG